MEEEVEDIVGEVAYTDSQKTLGFHSGDYYAESSSDKNYSSGRETYVLDVDESSDSEQFRERIPQEVEKVLEEVEFDLPLVKSNGSTGSKQGAAVHRTTSVQTCSVETFTQTSKTIIELAKAECQNETQTLETQTSFVCITERTVQYTSVQYSDNGMKSLQEAKSTDTSENFNQSLDNQNGQLNICLDQSLEDYSSKCPESKSPSVGSKMTFESSDSSSNEEIIRIIHGDSEGHLRVPTKVETKLNVTDYLLPKSSDSDFDEDSIAEYNYNAKHNSLNNSSATSSSSLSEVSKSVDKDVQDLYNKLSESIDLLPSDRSGDFEKKKFGMLTPLSEESLTKKTSTVDNTPTVEALIKDDDKDVLFTNDSGIKVKMFPEEKRSNEPFKLPPIQRNLSCPNSPHLSMLFTGNSHPQSLSKAETLPCLFKGDVNIDRWANNEMASGESVRITEKNGFHLDPTEDKKPVELIQLPPIYAEKHKQTRSRRPFSLKSSVEAKTESTLTDATSISIQAKIKELKMSEKIRRKPRHTSLTKTSVNCRSLSPGSTAESDRLETVERGCDALCLELLKRLRASSWFDVAETLIDIPNSLRKFWGVINEQRIADFIRQLSLHVDSPRTQVAKSACATLASILKNTNYTKKPDFYEAVTLLLVKTGSFSRPVRRAANVALDEVVCHVDLNHAIAALCVHGVEHKSPLVRTASARLLVVCAAIGGGGRDILRARPSSAATARRQTLRSMSGLLDDKSNDARLQVRSLACGPLKDRWRRNMVRTVRRFAPDEFTHLWHYAERLYLMLRPLPNFEAYYLTDVPVDVASRQMKKYDRLVQGEVEVKDIR